MAGFYVRRGEKIVGPASLDQLHTALTAGKLRPTDFIAEDPAGPWIQVSEYAAFRDPSPAVAETKLAKRETVELVSKSIPPIAETKTPENKTLAAARGIFVATKNAGFATLRSMGEVISVRSQRRHELKIEKIRAQAMIDAQRASAPTYIEQAAAPPPQPTNITFSPNLVQSTVVKIKNQNGGGCGCSGCGSLILLLILAFLAWALLRDKTPTTTDHSSPPAISTPAK